MHLGQGVRISVTTPHSNNAERSGLLAGVYQHLANEHRRLAQWRPRHPPNPTASRPGGLPDRPPHRHVAEGLLGGLPDRLQVDAEGAQQFGVAGARLGHQPAVGQPAQCRPGRGQVDAMGFQCPTGAAAAVAQHSQDQVLGPQVAVLESFGLGPGQIQDPVGVLTALGHLATSESRTAGRRTCGARPAW
jgi:hypothetical protein